MGRFVPLRHAVLSCEILQKGKSTHSRSVRLSSGAPHDMNFDDSARPSPRNHALTSKYLGTAQNVANSLAAGITTAAPDRGRESHRVKSLLLGTCAKNRGQNFCRTRERDFRDTMKCNLLFMKSEDG